MRHPPQIKASRGVGEPFAATHELITRLHGEVMADIAGLRDEVWKNHAAVMAQFEKLSTKLSEQ